MIAENGRARRGNLVQAIFDAGRHGIDLLNISIGIAHHEEDDHDCGGHCRVADEARLAIKDGLTIVAAAGNREKGESLAVNCPARVGEAIGIGGFVSHCTSDLIEAEESGQYWVRDNRVRGPFCGQRGCNPEKSCADHRYEKPWAGNVAFQNTTPEALAPVHHPAGTAEKPILQSGTSFGTPVVSGFLATILGDLLEEGINPSPEEIRTAVKRGVAGLDEGEPGKFQAGRTWESLHGNDFRTDDSSTE